MWFTCVLYFRARLLRYLNWFNLMFEALYGSCSLYCVELYRSALNDLVFWVLKSVFSFLSKVKLFPLKCSYSNRRYSCLRQPSSESGVEMKTDFLFSLSFVFTFFRFFLFSLSFIFMDNSENWYIYFWIKVISDISLFSWKVIFHISRKCFHLSTVKCWNKTPLSYWWRNKTLFERSILLSRESFCFYCISLYVKCEKKTTKDTENTQRYSEKR